MPEEKDPKIVPADAPKIVPDAAAKAEAQPASNPAAAAAVASADGDEEIKKASTSTVEAPLRAASESPAHVPVPAADQIALATVGGEVVPAQIDQRLNRNLPADEARVIPGITPASPRNMPAMGSDETMKLATHPAPTSEAHRLNCEAAAANVSAGNATHAQLAEAAAARGGTLKEAQEEEREKQKVSAAATAEALAKERVTTPAGGADAKIKATAPGDPVTGQPVTTTQAKLSESAARSGSAAPGGVPGL